MSLQPYPPTPVCLTLQQIHALDDLVVDSVLNCRKCGSCGSAAFGLEPQHSQFRSFSREPGVNDRALSLSSLVNKLAISIHAHGVQCVWLYGSCRNVTQKQLGDFLPLTTVEHAENVSTVPFSQLHETSFVDVSYKLTTHAHGYVTGEFASHSLVNGPLLADPHQEHHQHDCRPAIWDYVTNHCMLYQEYVPLR